MNVRVLQIEGLAANDIIQKFDTLEKQLSELKECKISSNHDQYLTRSDVAELFKVSLVTVHDWTRKGLLKSFKLANRVYYKRGEIEQALTEIRPKR